MLNTNSTNGEAEKLEHRTLVTPSEGEKDQLAELNEDSLLEEAQQQTGLNDFGDERFREGLRVLIESIDREAHLHYWGQKFWRTDLVRRLVNRLQIQEEFKLHPEILQVPIKRPLFIVGLPRTGSTLLQRLLSQAPSSRWLHYWEMVHPCPSPEYQTTTDPRIKKTAKELKAFFFLTSAKKGHLIDVYQPEECSPLLENNFIYASFWNTINVPSYLQWLDSQDLVPTYQYYRQQLQLLAWKWSGDYWVLKNPFHLENLGVITSVFTDACIIQTHRDPLKVIPSISKLHQELREAYSDWVQPESIVNHELNSWSKALERGLKARETIPHQQIYDVQYSDLVKDPIGTVRQIHDYFGYEYSPEMEQKLHQYMSENPRHKHGKHNYSLEECGLDAKMINQKFEEYIKKFNIPQE